MGRIVGITYPALKETPKEQAEPAEEKSGREAKDGEKEKK